MGKQVLIIAGIAGLALAAWAVSSQASINPSGDGSGGDTGAQGGILDWLGLTTAPIDYSASTGGDGGVADAGQSADPGLNWNPIDLFGIGSVMTGSIPLGLSQNNPGNLRAYSPSQPTAHGFRVFPTMQAGLDEFARQLLVYYKRGLNTIRAIITTYAPASENPTSAYVSNVASRTGLNPDQPLDLTNNATLAALMAAMIQQEQGQQPFSTSQLQQVAATRIQTGTAVA